MAFQIADDLLDYTQTEAVTGKPCGLDLKEHKVTLPLIAALAGGRLGREGRRQVETLMATAEPPDDPPGTRVGSHGLRDAPKSRFFEMAV